MRRRKQARTVQLDAAEVEIVPLHGGTFEVWVFLRGSLAFSAEAQDEIERHQRKCAVCRSRRQQAIRGVGPYGFTIRILPQEEKHWAEILAALLASPGALERVPDYGGSNGLSLKISAEGCPCP